MKSRLLTPASEGSFFPLKFIVHSRVLTEVIPGEFCKTASIMRVFPSVGVEKMQHDVLIGRRVQAVMTGIPIMVSLTLQLCSPALVLQERSPRFGYLNGSKGREGPATSAPSGVPSAEKLRNDSFYCACTNNIETGAPIPSMVFAGFSRPSCWLTAKRTS